MTFNRPLPDSELIACPHCDQVQRTREVATGETARCARCNEQLWRYRGDSIRRTMALALTAVVLYLITNLVPMLGLTVVGREASTTVFGGATHLWANGQPLVAVLVMFTVIIAPAAQIILTLVIVGTAMRSRIPSWVGTLLSYQGSIQTWSMVEVMLLGVIVALVKIADYATVIPGTALFALGALAVMLAAMQINFEPREIWERIEWRARDEMRAPMRASSGLEQ